jgi:hypothetical protein
MWSPHETERAKDCLSPRNAVLGHLQTRYPEKVLDPVAQPRGGGLGYGFNSTVVYPVYLLRVTMRQWKSCLVKGRRCSRTFLP